VASKEGRRELAITLLVETLKKSPASTLDQDRSDLPRWGCRWSVSIVSALDGLLSMLGRLPASARWQAKLRGANAIGILATHALILKGASSSETKTC